MLSIFKHLLPRAKAWNITINKRLRQFFEGLGPPIIDDAIGFFDDIWADMFPATTRELIAWETAYGLLKTDLNESERRSRLAAYWQATGGQNPKYIQDTLQNAGFNVYVHEWWEVPAADPPVARNPFEAFNLVEYGCDDPELECGEPAAECANSPSSDGYMLVNKLYTADIDYTVTCGDDDAECGESIAECGENNGFLFDRIDYPIPQNPDYWPYIYYISDQTFPDVASVSSDRMDEFEDLILKISPTSLWVGMLVSYDSVVIEDSTGNDILEDAQVILL